MRVDFTCVQDLDKIHTLISIVFFGLKIMKSVLIKIIMLDILTKRYKNINRKYHKNQHSTKTALPQVILK